LQDLGIDTRPVAMRPGKGKKRPCSEPGCFYDDWGVKWKEVDTGATTYRELAESPLLTATLADLETYPWWPDPSDPARYAGVGEDTERLFCESDYALVACPSFNGVWERAWMMAGFERMLAALVLDPGFVHGLLRKITDICQVSLGHFLDLVGSRVQIVKMGDDLGTQNGPMMSPHTYRTMVKPYHAELFRFIKARTPARIFLHSCGSVYRLLPDLIDAGVEVLNPVQVSAKDMDTRRLKAEFGDRLSFMGAIDTQHVLPFGTTDQVQREVERRIDDLGHGGGFIVAPVHNVQADVPAENLVAMYRHARVVGRYPLNAF
jgi:uroporphyrinogen decarboxylase